MNSLFVRFVPPLVVGLLIWHLPSPEGIQVQAWRLLAIFVATIVGIMVKTLPMGAVAIIGATICMVTGTLAPADALSGFSNPLIWLIVSAFFISRGFIVTGLGHRIAYLFMAVAGKSSLGLAYSMIGVDLVLAPVIPSNTARCAGVVFPILRSVIVSYGSTPAEGTARLLGSFLVKVSFQASVVISALFLTSMAGNTLAVQLAGEMGIQISWTSWTVAAVVPGLLSLAIVPWILYKVYPPDIKETPDAVILARSHLKQMGALKTSEWIMSGTFVVLLTLWIFGKELGMSSTVAALTGLGLLILTGTLRWEDILRESGAWDTLVWFAVLVMMAGQLNELGLIAWFGNLVAQFIGGVSWQTSFLILSLLYFYSHYLFASNTAHITSMYAPFLAVAIVVGTPPLLAALVLGFFSNLFSGMTHYGTGPAPVFFGSGYVEMGTWWRLGGVISVVNILIWLIVGGLWWKFLGIW